MKIYSKCYGYTFIIFQAGDSYNDYLDTSGCEDWFEKSKDETQTILDKITDNIENANPKPVIKAK